MHDTNNTTDNSTSQIEERFLIYADAAQLIGYRSYNKISELVKMGALPSYSIPLSERKRIKKSDLISLVLDSTVNPK